MNAQVVSSGRAGWGYWWNYCGRGERIGSPLSAFEGVEPENTGLKDLIDRWVGVIDGWIERLEPDSGALVPVGAPPEQKVDAEPVYSDKQLVILRTGFSALRISGAIDEYNAEAVAGALKAQLLIVPSAHTTLSDAITGNGDLHLDLNDLQFSDVSGIRSLVGLAEGMGPGRRLVLQGLPPLIRKVMTVVGWGEMPSLVIEEGP